MTKAPPPPQPTRRSPRQLEKKGANSVADGSVPKTPGKVTVVKGGGLSDSFKLLIGAGGIYASFLYYGILQEDVFRYISPITGTSFHQAWFLQVIETITNVVVAFIGLCITRNGLPISQIPMTMFGISGASQVTSKACTSLALANGLSFPVATLAKSGKMAPVMAGSLLLGGAKYSLREYIQVLLVIGGTAIVGIGSSSKSGGGGSTTIGVAYICTSLLLDGITAGFQKRLKQKCVEKGAAVPKSYDYMLWTNVWMCVTAIVISGILGEFTSGLEFCLTNAEIMEKVIKFSICSAIGQSFIFYTISNFDPLVLSTVTTTRKIFSVLFSIVWKGHSLSTTGWSGIGLSCLGVLSELSSKAGGRVVKRAV